MVAFIKFRIIEHQPIFTIYLPRPNRHYNTHQYSKVRQIFSRTETFSDSFLIIREWNKLDTSICQAPSYSVFCKALLDFMQPTRISTFGTNDVLD